MKGNGVQRFIVGREGGLKGMPYQIKEMAISINEKHATFVC